MASLDLSVHTMLPDHDERVMTTPDPKTHGQTPASQTPPDQSAGANKGAWGAVARLLSLQLLAVVAVTAVITGIYALAGGHKTNQVAAGSSAPATTASPAAGSKQPASTPPASPPASPATSTSPPASPTTSQPPASAKRLKVDVLNESAPNGIAARTAARVRSLGWTVGRISNFRGTVSATTVYYPTGQAKAARELAAGLPGKPRVFPRFSTLASNRLTIIVTR